MLSPLKTHGRKEMHRVSLSLSASSSALSRHCRSNSRSPIGCDGDDLNNFDYLVLGGQNASLITLKIFQIMAWIALLVSVLALWFASLLKILHGSSSSPKAAFLDDDGQSSPRRKVLLVIAHPDDESMFFAPVINYLISRGHNLHVLCMSTGNADGMGSIRKEELYLASAILKIPTKQVNILDHPDFQDGFGKVWDWNLLASIIDEETRLHSIDLIITFDDYGISGHCNHRDVHEGVRKLLHDSSTRHLEAWELVSMNIVRKYIGPVDIWLSILFARHQKNGESHCLLNLDPRKSYAAMAQHSSQWVWYRKLFVAFSSCTYVNTLKKIE